MEPSTRDMLTRGLQLLQQEGWCQNALVNSAGQRCAIGAIVWREPGGVRDVHRPAERLLNAIGQEQFPDRASLCPGDLGSCILLVNNHPDTTFADIEMIFEKAILRAEELHG